MNETDRQVSHDTTFLVGSTLARFYPSTKQVETVINLGPIEKFSSLVEARKHFSSLFRTSRRWAQVGFDVAAAAAIEHLFYTPPDSIWHPLQGALFIGGLAIALKRGFESAQYNQLLNNLRVFDYRELPPHKIGFNERAQKGSNRLVRNLSSNRLSSSFPTPFTTNN